MSARLTLSIGAAAMFLAVALGAFGAHALRAQVAPEMAAVWQTGVQYHAMHALALLAVGVLMERGIHRGLTAAALCFLVGIVLFSGSLYALVLTGMRGLGAITPVGGAAFLAGWAVLAWSVWRR